MDADKETLRPAPRRPSGEEAAKALHRAEQIFIELRALLRDALRPRLGSRSLSRTIRLDLSLELNPFPDRLSPGAPSEERAFAERLLGNIQRAVEDEMDRDAPFPQGRVHCFWCGGFDCAHAAPEGPRTTFAGYGPTGLPLWKDFATVALERRDPRIDDLYSDPPVPLAILQVGRDLASAQLPVYGKHSGLFRILGQVAVGYLSLLPGPGPERIQVALTFQAVEVFRGRRPHVHLNVLGRLPDGADLWRFLEEEPDSRLADALRSARGRLQETALRREHRSAVREKIAVASLARLARNLDRIFRQSTRRTRHAQERHRDRERPAAAALRDAISARPESILRDMAKSTWVIIGPRCRVHFFNDAGQHVTSVVYSGEAVRTRTAQGKWRAAPADSVRLFRQALEKSAGTSGKAAAAGGD